MTNAKHEGRSTKDKTTDEGRTGGDRVRTRFATALIAIACCATAFAQPASPSKGLITYVIDTEGGKAVLWITPSGQTVLVDSGNPGGRDTDRLMDAIKDAGVTKIDYLISTHYHVDHIGGLQELTKRIPVGTFVDHGPSV